MKIVTYCTFKGSAGGYAYSSANLFDGGKIKCDQSLNINEKIKEWFENRSNWKMVLLRSANIQEGQLLLGRLESSVNLENKRRRMIIEEKELSNSFRTRKVDVKKDISFLETEKLINIFIKDSYQFLERLAIGILCEFNKDYGVSLYTDISETMVIKNSEEYYFDWEKLRTVLNKYEYKNEITKHISEQPQSGSILNGFALIRWNTNVKKNQIVIEKNSIIKEYDFIPYILENWNITEGKNHILYISENDNIAQYGKYCIGIDFDYFFRMD